MTEWMANSKTDGTSTWANLFVDNLDGMVLDVSMVDRLRIDRFFKDF